MLPMRFLPVFLDLAAGTVMLVGSGELALNKLRLLSSAGARVRWFVGAADIAAVTSAAAPPNSIEIVTADPLAADLADVVAIVSAAGRPFDDAIAARARAARIPLNVVDRPDLSTFVVPAIVDRGDVVVAISTGGAAPVLARRLRERIEAVLPLRIGRLSALMGHHRARLAAVLTDMAARRRFWERVVDGPIGRAVLAGAPLAEAALAAAVDDGRREGNDGGLVQLVGAGPGDPDLLTLRALQALQDADVVFYDELVTPEILDRARRDAERVFVGKRRGQRGIGQEAIHRRLVEAARAGKRVVRLKGGDPFIFGRGGEELEALREAGIATVVVPGITAVLGCAAEAALPLTFRGEATRLAIVTAHRADEADAIDWSGHADPHTTVVVYMGLAAAAGVRDGLIAAGRDPATPAAILARGTRPDARAAVGRLDALTALASQAGDGPALFVIGSAVTHSDAWRRALAARLSKPEAA
jgi:uroporphyrin-III C-methyltransferase/precorrin-2 dehydrogenase/sirohydrochlorin ferrochelatase